MQAANMYSTKRKHCNVFISFITSLTREIKVTEWGVGMHATALTENILHFKHLVIMGF